MRQLVTLAAFLAIALGMVLPTAAQENEAAKTRFAAYDVYLDSGSAKLAAWQFELAYDKNQVALVGLEGGEGGAFPPDQPPAYDRKGLTAGRIIVANFSTAKDLPAGKFRVARIHVRLIGEGEPEFKLKLVAAADSKGERITAEVTIIKFKQEK